MSDEFNIEKVLPFLFCTQCGSNFDIECAKILATGNDTVIVKVVCKGCGKKYALAFMDLTFPMFAQSINETSFDTKIPSETLKNHNETTSLEDEHCFEETYSANTSARHIENKNLEKITYDDVLEAHDFIQNFEENWRRYLDKRKYKAI